MAELTLSTRLSRRSMLAGGAVAALPVTSPAELDNQRVDAGLLRRIAAAQICLSAFRQAEAACFRLQQALRDCPDVPDQTPSCPEEGERWDALLEQTGIAAADLRCEYLYARYEAALAAVFAMPARSLAGVQGKLHLAVTAIKQEQSELLDAANCAYLDATLNDLERFVDR